METFLYLHKATGTDLGSILCPKDSRFPTSLPVLSLILFDVVSSRDYAAFCALDQVDLARLFQLSLGAILYSLLLCHTIRLSPMNYKFSHDH